MCYFEVEEIRSHTMGHKGGVDVTLTSGEALLIETVQQFVPPLLGNLPPLVQLQPRVVPLVPTHVLNCTIGSGVSVGIDYTILRLIN